MVWPSLDDDINTITWISFFAEVSIICKERYFFSDIINIKEVITHGLV